MALLPLLLDQVYNRPASLFDQNFGLGIYNDELPLLIQSGYIRPWRHLSKANSGVSSLVSKNGAFHVNLDVQQFKPDEIAVKTEDNFVVIECKHEEKQDQHGFVSRQFVRKYLLPDTVDKEKVECKLSSDGVLSITAPKLVQEGVKSQTIPIQHTNQPALRGDQAQKSAEQEKEKEK